ncbi:MAG: hypothetical protein IJA02_08995 [Clostridia bacterium]|nr:hypothetical protein [Clostridia bacterium]
MASKSLLSSTLSLSFFIAAYASYISAIIEQNSSWIVVSALIYFIPMFVNFVDDFQNVKIHKKSHLIFLIACLILGFIYVAFLVSYISAFGSAEQGVPIIVKVLLIVLPVVCIPLKAYPFIVTVMQIFNRTVDTLSK